MPADSPTEIYERLRYWAGRYNDDNGRMPTLEQLMKYVRERQSIAGIPVERMPANGFGYGGESVVGFSVKTCRGPNGSFGCTIGVAPMLGVVGYGHSPEDALHTTAAVASDLHGMLQEHPELEAILPPGTGLALKGVALASQALKEGRTLDDIKRNLGPATGRMVSRLISLF